MIFKEFDFDFSKMEKALERNLDRYFKYDPSELTEEKFEVIKGDIKTNITVKFNKKGYAVSSDFDSVRIPSEKEIRITELKKNLEDAVRARDYRKAADLQDQLRALETN